MVARDRGRSGEGGPTLGEAVSALVRAPVSLCAAVVVAALTALAGSLPLLEVPGLELGLAVAIGSALALGPALGFTAARQELRRSALQDRPPRGELAAGAAALVASALVLLALGVATARAALFTRCAPAGDPGLFLAQAWPSALLGAALAAAASTWARARLGRAVVVYASLAAIALAGALLRAYLGPAASVYDHLLGVWPGPLYDEAVPLDGRLLLARGEALGWAALLAGAAGLLEALQGGWRSGEGARARASAAAGRAGGLPGRRHHPPPPRPARRPGAEGGGGAGIGRAPGGGALHRPPPGRAAGLYRRRVPGRVRLPRLRRGRPAGA